MRAHNISALVVGEPHELVSIVTERDLTQALADARPEEIEVGTIGSVLPLTVSPDATVMDVVTLMLREGVRHLVVTRGDRAVGVRSMRDALAALSTRSHPTPCSHARANTDRRPRALALARLIQRLTNGDSGPAHSVGRDANSGPRTVTSTGP